MGRSCGASVPIHGVVDQVTNNIAYGWCYSPDAPDDSCDVRIEFEGNVISGPVPANKNRPDVLAAGFGTGIYGFAIDIPTDVLGDIVNKTLKDPVELYLIACHQEAELVLSKISVQFLEVDPWRFARNILLGPSFQSGEA